MRSNRRSGRRWFERGAAAVEMALVLPMLLLVLGGIVDFGRYLYYEIQMANAVREGARVAVIGEDDAAIAVRVTSGLVVPGVTTSDVSITGCDSADDAIVSLETSFNWFLLDAAMGMIPGGGDSLPDTVKAEAAMRCEV